MKIVMNQNDVEQACSDWLQTKFKAANWFDLTGYVYIPDLTFEEATEEYRTAKAKQEAEVEAFKAKMMAEDAAKAEAEAAAKFAIDNAVTGNKS